MGLAGSAPTRAGEGGIDPVNSAPATHCFACDASCTTYAIAVADVLELEPDEIHPGQDYRKDLEIDSLRFFKLVLELEESFEIDIEESAAESLRTTDEGFSLVCGYLGA